MLQILCWFAPSITMNQPQAYICPLPPEPPPTPSHPPRLSQSMGFSSLSQTANSLWLSLLHMVVFVVP